MYVFNCRQSKIPIRITFKNCSTQISKWIKFNYCQSIGKCHRKYFLFSIFFSRFSFIFAEAFFISLMNWNDTMIWVLSIRNRNVKCISDFSSANWNWMQTNYYWSSMQEPRTLYTNGNPFLNTISFPYVLLPFSVDILQIFSFAIGIGKCDELIHDDSMIKPSDEVKIFSLFCAFLLYANWTRRQCCCWFHCLHSIEERFKSIELFCKRSNCHNTATNTHRILITTTEKDTKKKWERNNIRSLNSILILSMIRVNVDEIFEKKRKRKIENYSNWIGIESSSAVTKLYQKRNDKNCQWENKMFVYFISTSIRKLDICVEYSFSTLCTNTR